MLQLLKAWWEQSSFGTVMELLTLKKRFKEFQTHSALTPVYPISGRIKWELNCDIPSFHPAHAPLPAWDELKILSTQPYQRRVF